MCTVGYFECEGKCLRLGAWDLAFENCAIDSGRLQPARPSRTGDRLMAFGMGEKLGGDSDRPARDDPPSQVRRPEVAVRTNAHPFDLRIVYASFSEYARKQCRKPGENSIFEFRSVITRLPSPATRFHPILAPSEESPITQRTNVLWPSLPQLSKIRLKTRDDRSPAGQ